MILDCTFRGRKCKKEHFKHFLNPSLINCYTFDPTLFNSTESNDLLIGPRNGLSLILRSEPNPNFVYEVLDNTVNVDSIRVVIHPHGTVPFLMNNGINLEPGKSTSVSMLMKRYQRLGSPYTDCQGTQYFEIDGREFQKTSRVCREQCIVQTIRDRCNCTSTMFEDLSASNFEYCLDFQGSKGPEALNDRSRCETEFVNFLPDLDCKHCIWDCNELEYDTQIAFADWPHENKIDSFVATYVLTLPCDNIIRQYYTTLRKFSNLISGLQCPITDVVNDTRRPFSMVSLSNAMDPTDPLRILNYARPDFTDVYRYQ